MREQSDYADLAIRRTDTPEPLVLRDYQEELSERACRGENVVICAPTGAGKTEVAVHIAAQHLRKMTRRGLTARVVILVPKVPLVEQQRDRFLRYMDLKYNIEGFKGESSTASETDKYRRRNLFLSCHVAVMIPAIFLNMLNDCDDSKVHMNEVTLLIFDEVHHCREQHPYNELMNVVHNTTEDVKPQCIGLSASLLVGGAGGKSFEAAWECLLDLCANVGALCISWVRRHRESLERHVRRPENETIHCLRCHKLPFQKALERLMHEIETHTSNAMLRYSRQLIGENGLTKNEMRFESVVRCLPYFQKVHSMRLALDRIKKQVDDEDGLMEATLGLDYLKLLSVAFAVADLLPSQYAVSHIESGYKNIAGIGHTKYSHFYAKLLKDTLSTLRVEAQREDVLAKPVVKNLVETIQDQLERNADSRVIVFAETRRTVALLKRFLNESHLLSKHEQIVDFAVSANGKTDANDNYTTSQTAAEQKRVLEDFKSGKLKVLLGTTVVEEGLDVQSCNLVIKYNIGATVVQAIQRRGRARAKDARCVSIVLDDELIQQEVTADASEKFMMQCFEQIVVKGEQHFSTHVGNVMQAKELTRKKQLETQVQHRRKRKSFYVLCRVDNNVICHSRYVRQHKSNFVCVDPNVWKRVRLCDSECAYTKDGSTQVLGMVACRGNKGRHCNNNVARGVISANHFLPMITIKEVVFREEGVAEDEVELVRKSKWKLVDEQLFHIPTATDEEIEMMTKYLSDTL